MQSMTFQDAFSSEDAQEFACWICLEGQNESKGALIAPCRCSQTSGRFCHTRCLARWQLQSAGTRRETTCDFCGDQLPNWKQAMTPPCGAHAPAIMNVNFGGSQYSFQVRPGPEGYNEFTQAICRAFALPADADLSITFTCDEPSSGALLTLQGAGAYDAAVHCASVSAARRQPPSASTPPTRLIPPGSPGASSDGGMPSPLRLMTPGSPGGSSSGAPSPVRGGAADGGHGHHKGGKGLSALSQRIRSVFSDFFL